MCGVTDLGFASYSLPINSNLTHQVQLDFQKKFGMCDGTVSSAHMDLLAKLGDAGCGVKDLQIPPFPNLTDR